MSSGSQSQPNPVSGRATQCNAVHRLRGGFIPHKTTTVVVPGGHSSLMSFQGKCDNANYTKNKPPPESFQPNQGRLKCNAMQRNGMQCKPLQCNILDAHHRMYNKSPVAGSVAEECWRPRIQGSSSQRGQHPLHSRPSLTTVCSIGGRYFTIAVTP